MVLRQATRLAKPARQIARLASTSAPRADATDATAKDPSRSASRHLFDAAAELEEQEEEALRKRSRPTAAEDPVWTGDERIKDSVLRMIMDVTPPLRVAGYKKEIQQPTMRDPLADLPRAPRVEDDSADLAFLIHRPREGIMREATKKLQPWEVKIKPPEDYTEAPVRPGFTISPQTRLANGKAPTRLSLAKEASFDYASGEPELAKAKASAKRYNLPGGARGPGQGPLPTTLKGYGGYVEDKIQRAQEAGIFRNNKFKGKPIEYDENVSNPFIDTTERLMNRIVQRQGAAPPWIELQQECDRETLAWHLRLREEWRRRAVRMLSLTGGPPPSLEIVRGYRDAEWVERESAYHNASLKDLNGLIRRYNGAAPAAVRRNLITLRPELDACYADSAEEIHAELVRRHLHGPGDPTAYDKGEGRGRTGGILSNAAYSRPREKMPGLWSSLVMAFSEFKTLLPRSPTDKARGG